MKTMDKKSFAIPVIFIMIFSVLGIGLFSMHKAKAALDEACYQSCIDAHGTVAECTADCTTPEGGGGGGAAPTTEGGGSGKPSGGGATTLPNPLGTNLPPEVIIGNILNAALGLVGSLALAVFILGGFYWVTSAGNEEKVKKGKDMIMWASLGLAVIFTSYALVNFVIRAITGT